MALSTASPIFVGGTNGSGTRIYARLLQEAGVFQGAEKNYAFEPADIIQYTRPLVPELIKLTGAPVYDPSEVPVAMARSMRTWIAGFSDAIQRECPASGYRRWGWKHPRNMFLAPFLDEQFPDCHFVHVVRDGRDMAFAANTGDADAMFESILGRKRLSEIDYTEFWSAVNLQVSKWAVERLGMRYVSSKFEDLCSDPFTEMVRIADAVGLTLPKGFDDLCVELVKTPPTVGRWQDSSARVKSELIESGRRGLNHFEYLS